MAAASKAPAELHNIPHPNLPLLPHANPNPNPNPHPNPVHSSDLSTLSLESRVSESRVRSR
jgi:hypothetical protein